MTSINSETRVHFIGIGGVGMGALAEVLLAQNIKVSGSDVAQGAMTQHLQESGATIYIGHAAENIEHVDAVVVSSAIADDNPELLAAKQQGRSILHRAQLLAYLMQQQTGVAIAGTHGKTTTTGLVSHVLLTAKLDPTFVIGGLLQSLGCNAQLGKGEYLIAEADESDASFLYLTPKIAIVTNIDADHLQTYQGDFNKLQQAFVEFLERLPEDGLLIACVDDPIVENLLAKLDGRVITYGFSKRADARVQNYRQNGLYSEFSIDDEHYQLHLAGKHNVLNATAAIVLARELLVDEAVIASALQNFPGVGRRFNLLGELPLKTGSALLVDDYAHHPKEIEATLSAARAVWPQEKIRVVFQPHRYTRTQDLFAEFADVLATTDDLLLLDIYPASEQPIEGVNSASLAASIKEKGLGAVNVVAESELFDKLQSMAQDKDIILCMGAGSIGRMARELLS